uniref:ATP-dependent clp protease ATP binding subunit n=1 Tax=Heterosigma akashiwo TaxID=2829 RepID=A0A224APR6_HETAK|nr:ATP-dependent clp protease ATP binding subunit [Heterosigma akashiwo]
MFERFTEKALRVILLAQEESRRTGHNFVGTEQIVLGLIGEGTGIGSRALRNADVKLSDARREVDRLIGRGTGFVSVEIPFTPRAKSILEQSLQQARAFTHSYIGTEHLLLALLEDEEGVAAQLLLNLKVDLGKVRRILLQEIGELADAASVIIKRREEEIERKIQEIIENDRKRAAQAAEDESERKAKIEDFKRRMSAKMPDLDLEAIFRDTEVKKQEIREEIREQLRARFDTEDFRDFFVKELDDIFEEEKSEEVMIVVDTPVLNEFSTNLSAMVEDGSVDPVIGREKEVERVTQILSRRRKNNPILIGEPGVGKTAVAEGLALRIANQEITQGLANREVAVLDVGLLIAGTKYRGEFEERIKRIMEEIKRKKTMILVIDEIHTIIGAGSAEGSLDAANILKPALSRGELQCIGATTLDEYRTIEKDPALARRFQPVYVDEPSPAETLTILQGLRTSYEGFHNVRIPDFTLKRSIELSTGYIKDRFLPDKAIDLVDEASARVKITRVSSDDPEVKVHEKDLQRILADKDRALRGQDFELAMEIRDAEMTLRTRITAMIKNLETTKEGELEYQKVLPAVHEEHIADIISSWTGIPLNKLGAAEADKLIRMERELHQRVIGQEEAVTKISNAVKRSRVGISNPDRPIASFLFCGPTGVGKTELTKALGDYFFGSADTIVRLDMSEYMEKHTVARLIGSPPGYVGYNEGGQLTEAVRRRPFSLVLFDEVEKAHPDIFNLLLQVLDDGRLTDSQGKVIDFTNTIIVMTSNLGSKHLDSHFNKNVSIIDNESEKSDSNTIDSSFDEYKAPTFFWEDYKEFVKQDVKEKELTLAEINSSDAEYDAEMKQQLEKDIEKYYQEYEKQELEDEKFKELDAKIALDDEDEAEDDEVRNLVLGEVKSFFRPEFVNRIDDIIVFHPLRKSDVTQILEILINQLSKRLRKKNVVLHIDDDAKQILIDEGFDPAMGARPLRRSIQQNIENQAAQAVLETPVKTIRSLLLAVRHPYYLDIKPGQSKIKLYVFPLPSFILNKFNKDIISNIYNEKAVGFYANIVKGWLKEGGPYIEKRLGRYYEYDTSFCEIPVQENLAVEYAIHKAKRPVTREEIIGKGPRPDWKEPEEDDW